MSQENGTHQMETLYNREALTAALRDLAAGSEYARGVLDVLSLLGLVAPQGERSVPTGKVPRMVLDSLRAHLQDGVTVGLRWDDLDADGLRGVDVLRAIEEARREAVPDPTPGRVVRVAQAVIKAHRDGEDLYLMQYDRHAGRFQPIGGKQDPADPDLHATLRREMAEELGLSHPPGPEACTLHLLHADWRTTILSPTYGILTAYSINLFHVGAIRFPIATDGETRWLRREEIVVGRAEDGRAVSQVYPEVLGLSRMDGLPPGVA
ncbi:MAG TPA: hypothetical protein ENI95_08360 [Chloroflexi bacterium]|nr:hypothetical protein [Chloroflexota bacterium]